jgi:hypothetical protein
MKNRGESESETGEEALGLYGRTEDGDSETVGA